MSKNIKVWTICVRNKKGVSMTLNVMSSDSKKVKEYYINQGYEVLMIFKNKFEEMKVIED